MGLAARFWDLFEAPKQQSDDGSADADWRAKAAAGRAFVLNNVAVRAAGSAHASSAPSSAAVQRRFSLMFRCGPGALRPACACGPREPPYASLSPMA